MKQFADMHGLARATGLRLILGLFFVSSLILFIVAEFVNRQTSRYADMITELTQSHLIVAAQALSKLISAEELDRFHTTEDTQTPEYEEIRERLINFGKEYRVLYAYYWRDYGNGKLQYIVDNDLDPENQVGPWRFLDIEEVVERHALQGFTGATDLGNYTPAWKNLITGYAPVYDGKGNLYCVAGVDASDAFIISKRDESRKLTILQLIALPLSILFGIINMLLYRRKAIQIEDAHIKLQYFNNNLRRAFSTYLSEEVVEEIVSDPTRLQLGGVKRNMTALFTDVMHFTTIAESLPPEHLVDLLNYYLSSMSDIVLEQKGTIDKYEGDAIMAFFGAPLEIPDHALRACVAAIKMKRLEGALNKHVIDNGISPSPLLTRIGINSGEMVVGNMGTQKKMNYTIISNAVNMASRLEGVNKQYGTWILASETVVKETDERLLVRRLDRIRVVGINEAVRIYEILETKAEASSDLLEQLYLFHKALDIFEERRWQDAENAFAQVLRIAPGDSPSQLFIDRCRQFRDSPPAADWDGVFNLTEK
ncbi:MAG: adenylate/guanylate cyclase domain-containing protein [Treponema sp.]|jgi:class 3 adenylate cyclase|nr:adenylate/guanylate cyclase domain-containing protein [Treponema sp.]